MDQTTQHAPYAPLETVRAEIARAAAIAGRDAALTAANDVNKWAARQGRELWGRQGFELVGRSQGIADGQTE